LDFLLTGNKFIKDIFIFFEFINDFLLYEKKLKFKYYSKNTGKN